MRILRAFTFISMTALSCNFSNAQTVGEVSEVLRQPVQTPDVVEFQLRQYLMQKLPTLPAPRDAKEWSRDADKIRKRVLNDVIFHGWPRQWTESKPKFEDMGIIASGKGYRIRGLRYEIVPGFQTVAHLFEPEKVNGKAPAILNLQGHNQGIVVIYDQKRAINYALRGMFALNLVWFNCGQLQVPENEHWYGSHLNLAGRSATGLFYLAMRRGLDYLASHPDVDADRIGVTGLSGGGPGKRSS